jgi:hypothetical protein
MPLRITAALEPGSQRRSQSSHRAYPLCLVAGAECRAHVVEMLFRSGHATRLGFAKSPSTYATLRSGVCDKIHKQKHQLRLPKSDSWSLV